jgi:hypothetical protein
MQIVELSSSVAPSSVFQLWITQWRLGILDPLQSTFVLRSVLSTLRTKRPDDPFWTFLQEFFAPSVADSPATLPTDGVEVEHLLHYAYSLQPQQAKSLLEYLSQHHAFNGDNLEFWRAVQEAIELHAGAGKPVDSDFCRAQDS